MILFGIEFSAAQLVLLAANVILIVLCIAILRKLGNGAPVQEQAVAVNAAPIPAAKPQAAAQEDEELIAVITAAVAATMGKDAKDVRVTSYQEIKPMKQTAREYAGRSAWSKAGRAAQVNRYI